MGQHYGGIEGDTRSLDYSSFELRGFYAKDLQKLGVSKHSGLRWGGGVLAMAIMVS